MKKNEPVKHIMSSKIISATTKDKISHVKKLMLDHHINHVPILSGKKLVGLISRMDLHRAEFSDVFEGNGSDSESQLDSVATIENIMTRDIKTLLDSSTVRDAALLLASAHFHSLPILNQSEELVGFVTSKDIIRYLVEQY